MYDHSYQLSLCYRLKTHLSEVGSDDVGLDRTNFFGVTVADSLNEEHQDLKRH